MVEVELNLVLIVGGIVSIFSVIIVYLIFAYINPARHSPAWVFIRAKKKRKPVVLLDNGSFWKISVGENEQPGFLVDEEGSMVEISPNSMKSCMTVRLAVGEYNRSSTVDPNIVKFIELCENRKISPEKAKEILGIVEDTADKNKEDNNGVPKEKQEPEELADGLETF